MTAPVAVIDFGTNTARLLIAERDGNGSFRQLYLEREVVRLGGGFDRTSGLSDDAMKRGLYCLEMFSRKIREAGVLRVLAVATSAVRDAANGALFVRLAREKTGIYLHVIDGLLEGRLTLAGVMAGLDKRYDEMLMLDIGGGSTEYTLARSGKPHYVNSLPLGVVRLTEGKGTVALMQTKIRREIQLLTRDLAEKGHDVTPGISFVSTAGTATTLAAIKAGMEVYDYRRINNSTITRDEIRTIYERLLPLTPRQRLDIPGVEKGREDLVIAGILVTLETMDCFDIDTMKVSDYGLLEGLVVCGDTMVTGYGA